MDGALITSTFILSSQKCTHTLRQRVERIQGPNYNAFEIKLLHFVALWHGPLAVKYL